MVVDNCYFNNHKMRFVEGLQIKVSNLKYFLIQSQPYHMLWVLTDMVLFRGGSRISGKGVHTCIKV